MEKHCLHQPHPFKCMALKHLSFTMSLSLLFCLPSGWYCAMIVTVCPAPFSAAAACSWVAPRRSIPFTCRGNANNNSLSSLTLDKDRGFFVCLFKYLMDVKIRLSRYRSERTNSERLRGCYLRLPMRICTYTANFLFVFNASPSLLSGLCFWEFPALLSLFLVVSSSINFF